MAKTFVRSCALLAVFAVLASGCGGPVSSIPYAGISPASALRQAAEEAPLSSCLDTNKQLRTPVDPNAPREKAAYETWIAQNAIPVRSESCDRDFSDLQPFGAIVGDKRIVGLGESSHGVGDYSTLKVRLIKYLHEKLGFDVIAFEYPMFQDYKVNEEIRSFSPKHAMIHGCYGVWWSSEVLPLFRYIKEQASTSHPLILAGFDIQQYMGLNGRAAAFREVIAPVDPAYADRVAQQDLAYFTFLLGYTYPVPRKWRHDLHAMLPGLTDFYSDVSAWMERHMTRLVAAAKDKKLPGLMQQVANTAPAYAQELYILNNNRSSSVRDEAMAADVKYLATRLYPDKKIILWSHSEHIALGKVGWKNMGSRIQDDFGDAYYATGLLPFRGHGAYNNGQVYREPRPPRDSIDAILYYTRWRWAYVDMSQPRRGAGDEWMWGPPLRYDTFGSYYMSPPATPRKLYNGLMYVYLIHPPNYLGPRGARPREL